jgi:uncharacterized membrane protein
MTNNILYWLFKIPSVLLLIVTFILSIHGFLLFLLAEEFDGDTFADKINNDIKNF